LAELDIDVLLPLFFESNTALVPRQDRLAGMAAFLLPSPESFAIANDKLLTVRHCDGVGIPCPTTVAPEGDADLRAAAAEISYPAVVKARTGAGVDVNLRYANGPDELLRCCEELVAAGKRVLIQEYVPGYVRDACAVASNGETYQVLTQVRKLMYPVYGGVGAVNVTTRDPELAELARTLLASLRWSGPAMIEFKRDPRDGRYKLIELNPKFWGTLDLSLKVGIDFPGLAVDLALGRTVERDRPYPEGVRYVFLFERGVLAYLQMLRERGLRGVRDPQPYRRTFCDLDPFDPLPDLARVWNTIGILLAGRSVRVNENLPRGLLNPLDAMIT
jgi:predicted ATP-grasp superfamily ATP-dependent carboligase